MLKRIMIYLSVLIVLTISNGCASNKSPTIDNNVSYNSQGNDNAKSSKNETSDNDSMTNNNLNHSQFCDLKDFDLTSDEPVLIGDDYYVYGKIQDALKKELYDTNDSLVLQFDIVNDTDSEIYSDSSFQLEINIDGEWYITPPTNYFFNDLFDIYPKHGRYKYSVDLGVIDYAFPKGEYRFLKIYSMEGFDGTILCESKFNIM